MSIGLLYSKALRELSALYANAPKNTGIFKNFVACAYREIIDNFFVEP
jgi:hypothetical protein